MGQPESPAAPAAPLGGGRRAPTPRRMIGRGALCRCPRCGAKGVFTSWFRLRPRCPGCGLLFVREEGFWLGGYVINMAAGEAGILVLLAVLIGMLANGGISNPLPFVVIGILLATIGPVLTFPPSRTVWVAIYLLMQPLAEDEVVEARAAVALAAIEEQPVATGSGSRWRGRAGRSR